MVKDLHQCRSKNCAELLTSKDARSSHSNLDLRLIVQNHADAEETFAHNEKTGFGWMAAKKSPSVSTSPNWDKQNKVISSGRGQGRMPNVAEMAWFILMFKELRDIWLFPKIYVRTSSTAANGNPVFIGICNSYGIGIVNHHGTSCGGSIGVLTSVVE